MERQSHTEIVQATLQRCFETVVDFERYPDWFSGLEKADIIESDPDKGLWTVRYSLNMIIRTLSYTLSYSSTAPGQLQWTLLEGDVNDIEGSYDFVELEPGLTEATCRQGIDIGFWIPGLVKRGFEATALIASVKECKAAAESTPA